jgi:hypothetical protein
LTCTTRVSSSAFTNAPPKKICAKKAWGREIASEGHFPRPKPPSGSSSPAVRGETRFPYGGAKRIRFEGLKGRFLPQSQPGAPGSPKQGVPNKTRRQSFFNRKIAFASRATEETA